MAKVETSLSMNFLFLNLKASRSRMSQKSLVPPIVKMGIQNLPSEYGAIL